MFEVPDDALSLLISIYIYVHFFSTGTHVSTYPALIATKPQARALVTAALAL